MYTLTSALGRFEFENDVPLGQAKLIRDTVNGQWFNPKRGERGLGCSMDVEEFMRAHPTNTLARIPFKLILDDSISGAHLEDVRRMIRLSGLAFSNLRRALRQGGQELFVTMLMKEMARQDLEAAHAN